jgi:HSP20 family protein
MAETRELENVRIVRGDDLAALERAIERSIAFRAYELFSARGAEHGRDLEDWFEAESELIKPDRVRISDGGDAWIVHAGTRGFNAHEIQVGVSCRKLVIWGQHSGNGAGGAGSKMLGEIDLPSAVIPGQSLAKMEGSELILRVVKDLADPGSH